MPGIKKMYETMQKQGIPEEILAKFDSANFDSTTNQKGYRPEPRIAFIDLMDKLLTREQCLAVMEQQGCCKGGKRDKDCKAFAKEYADKPLTEKITLIAKVENMMAPRFNDNGTFTITMQRYQNGVHTGNTTCSCGAIMKLKQPFSVSSTYCGCCAGHFLYHYQNMLGVKLKLKNIDSSPLDTNGEKPCKFTFEIIAD